MKIGILAARFKYSKQIVDLMFWAYKVCVCVLKKEIVFDCSIIKEIIKTSIIRPLQKRILQFVMKNVFFKNIFKFTSDDFKQKGQTNAREVMLIIM